MRCTGIAASIEMAGALEQCARVKGAFASGEQLMAASGVHYMIANSGQVLVRIFQPGRQMSAVALTRLDYRVTCCTGLSRFLSCMRMMRM